MADTGQAQHCKQVKAAHPFKGSNNDELVFSKGDIITVTQCIEGGWWEGTLNGKTGWFPSNYVRDLKPGGDGGPKKEAPKVAPKPVGIVASPAKEAGINKRESMLRYRDLVLQNLTDTERTFTTDLQNLLQTYLRPLQQAAILSPAEFSELTGNLEEVVPLHQALLTALTDCAKQPNPQQRIGGLFLKTAPQLKKLYELYCGNHPTAVGVLQKRKDDLCKFMESKGAKAPGVMVLTTSLSRPFTRLDKYPNVLKEVERHTEESHADRGDTQRAISVYKEIATSCADIRKMKEMEMEILNSNIVGWEGEEISQLGSVLSLTHVRVHSENGEKKEHLFLLFPSVLVMLSLGPRMSGFVYEGKLPVSGMTVNPLEDTENYTHAFEITGGMIDRRVVSCATAGEQKHWVEALRHQAKHGPPPTPGKPQSLQVTSQPCVSSPKQAKMAQIMQQPAFQAHKSIWSKSCLLPSAPLRPPLLAKEDLTKSPHTSRKILGSVRRKPVDDPRLLEDDALILKVIEAYCTSAKTRHTVNSSLLECPSMLIAEEEKIIIEETSGNQTVVQEKSLVDTVYHLKDQVKELRHEYRRIRRDLDDERKSRKRLENMIRKSLKSLVETTWEEVTNA